VGLVFFRGDADLLQVRRVLRGFGGQLVHMVGDAFVGLFTHEVGENPARQALAAARSLLAERLARCARVDLHPVLLRARPDGGRDWMSPLFTRPTSYPSAPGTLELTRRALALVDEVTATASPRDGELFLLSTALVEPGSTVTRSRREGLIGRGDVLRALVASAQRALAEHRPTLCTIVADGGLGRSHLAGHLPEALCTAVPQLRLVELQAQHPISGQGDRTLRELLRRALLLGEQDTLATGRVQLSARLGHALAAEVLAGVAVPLGWLAPDADEVRAFAAVPGGLRGAAARASAAGLKRLAAEQPLVLLLDDAHLADDATLDALELATLPGPGAPLWICVFARPTFDRLRPQWGQRAASRHSERLQPLDGEAGAALCRRLLAPVENVPALAVERLVTRAQGNPLLLGELVRGLKAQGLVRRHEEGRTWYLATDELDRLPELPLLEWLASRELEALPAGAAAHARLSATLGDELSEQEIAGALSELERAGAADAFPLDARVATAGLLTAGLLLRNRRGRLVFRYEMLREAIYPTVPETLRREIHRAAYRYHSRADELERGERQARLAWHAAGGGLDAEAAGLYLALGVEAQQRHAFLAAESHYARALKLIPAADEAGRLVALNGRGMMRYRVGRHQDALDDFSQARQLAAQLGDREREANLLLDEAMARDWTNEYRASKELTERAQTLASQVDSPLFQARLLLARGRSAIHFADWRGSAELLEQAVAEAAPLGDEGYETFTVALLLLTPALALTGRTDAAEAASARAISTCEQHADRLHLITAVQNRLFLWTARRDAARALADVERSLELARELGMPGAEYRAEFNLADLNYQIGDWDRALEHATRAALLAESLHGGRARPSALLLKARALLGRGDLDAARCTLGELQRRQEQARASGWTEALLLAPEEVLARMVDLATGTADPAAWQALEEKAEALAEQTDPIEVVEMHALWWLRRADRPRAVAKLERALELAASIPNLMEGRLRRALAAATGRSP
jgi:hypothetical protein